MDPDQFRRLTGASQFKWLLAFAAFPGYFFGEWVGRELTSGCPFATAFVLAAAIAVACGLFGQGLAPSLLLAGSTGWGGGEAAWDSWLPAPRSHILMLSLAAALSSYFLTVSIRRVVRSHRYQD